MFLVDCLNDLVNRNQIVFFAFVNHFPEEDETKPHKHLYVEPNGLIQTDSLRAYLQELDLSDPLKKPLGVMPFNSSKFADWFLYSSHNAEYLLSKGQSRKYHYQKSDFITNESDYFFEKIATIDWSKYGKVQRFVEKARSGVSFEDMVISGQVPIPHLNQWKSLFEMSNLSGTHRNGRISHQATMVEISDEEAEHKKLPF